MARPRHAWTGGLAAILALGTGVAWRPTRAAEFSCAMSSRPEVLLGAAVRRVVDGDTLTVCLADGCGEQIRLVGVDVLNTVVRARRARGPSGRAAEHEVLR